MAECFCCSPFCGMWFFRYHQMTLEKFVWVWLKSEILCPKKLVFQSENLYLKCLEETIEIGTRSCRNGTELVERKRSKNRKRKEGGIRLIKTLHRTLKLEKRNLRFRSLYSGQSRYSGSGRMASFSPAGCFQNRSVLRISIIPLQAKRIRQKCFWIIPSF